LGEGGAGGRESGRVVHDGLHGVQEVPGRSDRRERGVAQHNDRVDVVGRFVRVARWLHVLISPLIGGRALI
jgi:hypothetical protein